MAHVIRMLKVEVLNDLRTIRDYLEANPPTQASWVAAQPKRPERRELRVGDHRPTPVEREPEQQAVEAPRPDPALAKLNDLLRVLNQMFAYENSETVAAVPDLSRLTKEAASLAIELGGVHKFDSIQLPALTTDKLKTVKTFEKIRSIIIITYKYFSTLAYYLTPLGKNYLRGVVQDQSEEWAGTDALVNIKDHHYGERIDPLAALRTPIKYANYLEWAQNEYKLGVDPIEHIVDYIVEVLPTPLLDGSPELSRLGTSKDLTPFIEVQIKSNVPGDERFSRPGLNRMWTYQVKIAIESSEYKEWKPGSEWTEQAWAKNAISLPTLRVVESQAVHHARAAISDFTKGSLYAIDASGSLFCFGTTKFHSALTNSAPIQAAGIIVAEAGRVVAIDNRSDRPRRR